MKEKKHSDGNVHDTHIASHVLVLGTGIHHGNDASLARNKLTVSLHKYNKMKTDLRNAQLIKVELPDKL